MDRNIFGAACLYCILVSAYIALLACSIWTTVEFADCEENCVKWRNAMITLWSVFLGGPMIVTCGVGIGALCFAATQ